jgi:hypothetical protein
MTSRKRAGRVTGTPGNLLPLVALTSVLGTAAAVVTLAALQDPATFVVGVIALLQTEVTVLALLGALGTGRQFHPPEIGLSAVAQLAAVGLRAIRGAAREILATVDVPACQCGLASQRRRWRQD